MPMDETLDEARRLVANHDFMNALEALHGIESNEGNQFEIAYLFGICHARLGNWDDALLYLEQVVTGALDTRRDEQCRIALAYVYSVTGRHKLAEYELRMLYEKGVESARVLSFLGYSAWAQGRPDESIDWYARALAVDPEFANALNGIGYVLACEGKDGARALTYCRKAVDLKPDNPAYLDSLAWAYHKLGFSDEARNQINKALVRAPESSEICDHARAIEQGEGST
jgi:tetratricopeptide (TPR) repeat protein